MSAVLLDDDDYVTIGTPFEIPDEDEPLPKPSKVEDQIVTDKHGRRRLHGAFTGGFSAGYFNTVGSKEGWAPSTFKSSRSKKNNEGEDQDAPRKLSKPEDFMDDEDFGEYGIAPKKLKTSASFRGKDTELESKKQNFLKAVDDGQIHSAIPGGIPLDDLVGTRDHSIGIKLLKKMGWKPGQGVGEKVEIAEEEIEGIPKKRVYGCAMPPKSKVETVDTQAFTAMLAPKDILPVKFERKDNLHGIGYYALLSFPSSGPRNVEINTTSKEFRPNAKKRGIRGTAFGVGIFEEEDYDVYGESEFSRHDMTMCNDKDPQDGWTGTTAKPKVHKDTLSGFVKSMKRLVIAPTQPKVPFEIPKEVPRHVFPENAEKRKAEEGAARSKLSSQERSDLLGETTKTMADVKHWSLKWDKRDGPVSTSSEDKSTTVANTESTTVTTLQVAEKTRFKPVTDGQDHNESKSKPSNDTQGVFQPFASNPDKQSRYNEYLRNKNKTSLNYDSTSGMTEWEKEQEIAEFSRAAVLYQPLQSAMSDRFVSANTTAPEAKTEDDTSSDMKAAEMGMFGKLTRTALEWHPDAVLCKRMNIPNPYPHSSLKGVPTRNSKHTSIFSEDFVGNMMQMAHGGQRRDIPQETGVDATVGNTEDMEPSIVKTEEEEIEEEFVARLQKNKGKMTKAKVGPLSHLNIKLEESGGSASTKPMPSTNPSQSGPSTSSSEVKTAPAVKPGMDIFKAIFENSDSDSSDEDEEDGTDKVVEGDGKSEAISVSVASASNTPSSDHTSSVTMSVCPAETRSTSESEVLNEQEKGGGKTGMPYRESSIHEDQVEHQHQQQKQKEQEQQQQILKQQAQPRLQQQQGQQQPQKQQQQRKPEKFDKLPLSFLNRTSEKSNSSVTRCTYGPLPPPRAEQHESITKSSPDSKSSRNGSCVSDNLSKKDAHHKSSENWEEDGKYDEHRKSKSKKRKKEKKSKKHKNRRNIASSDGESDESSSERRKHKKEKKSKKKKKTKKSRKSLPSSSSSSDNEEDSRTPSNAELLEKLKKLDHRTIATNDSSSKPTKSFLSETENRNGDRPTREKRKISQKGSASSSSSSDEEDIRTPSNAELLEKLKKVAPHRTIATNGSSRKPTSSIAGNNQSRPLGSRPTAADFM